jgi:hypothetical protein
MGMVGAELTTLVSYGTGIQRESVPCPHTIHAARGGGSLWPKMGSFCVTIARKLAISSGFTTSCGTKYF